MNVCLNDLKGGEFIINYLGIDKSHYKHVKVGYLHKHGILIYDTLCIIEYRYWKNLHGTNTVVIYLLHNNEYRAENDIYYFADDCLDNKTITLDYDYDNNMLVESLYQPSDYKHKPSPELANLWNLFNGIAHSNVKSAIE